MTWTPNRRGLHSIHLPNWQQPGRARPGQARLTGVKIICLTREFYKRPETRRCHKKSQHQPAAAPKRGNNKRATIMTFGANEWEAQTQISLPRSPSLVYRKRIWQQRPTIGCDSSLNQSLEPKLKPKLNLTAWHLVFRLWVSSFLVILLVIFLLSFRSLFLVPASGLGSLCDPDADSKRWENVKSWLGNRGTFCFSAAYCGIASF